ncbi:MAG: UvrD-helicase domain-containing protein [Treponema sp.]|jgi:ATP-dependent helicase/nuclease subunit A|nr:UvrD-helicase domain-containing protein [Treponema sp.]
MKDRPVLQLDDDQAAAYREDRNVTVSAGAGSGKTTVLAERYVRLVTQRNFDVESILTLTFTRKAAAEMYKRIFLRLSASDHPRAREQLAKFDQARISTLDAFCTALVRGASYNYGIPPDFRIDEKELRLNAEAAAVEVLMRRRQDPVVCRLVATRSFDAVVKELLGDLGLNVVSLVRPAEFRAQGQAQIDFIQGEIERICGELNRLGETILAIDDSPGKPETLAKAKAVLRSRLPLKAGFDAESIDALGDTAAFLVSGGSFRRPASNAKDPALVALRDPAEALKTGAASLVLLTDTLSFREDILALGALLDEYASLLLDRKRRKGLLGFRDTTELAVDILSRDRALRAYYKDRIRAIMIDEFQDNNELQKKLLYLLAEQDALSGPGIPQAGDLAPDKLFFVGDEKQSIYRFRGADVAVFRGLSRELAVSRNVPAPAPPASLSLKTNYRSGPALVAFFNALFPGVFGVPEEPFEAEYTEMCSAEAAPGEPAAPAEPVAPVEIYLRRIQKTSPESSGGTGEEGEEEIPDTAGEALAVAERIMAGIIRGEFSFGDLAVLFRTTTHQDEYERIFRQAGIPFSAADPRGIFFEGPANDFYAILRLVLFPRDRNAYGTVLRSPFTGLGNGTFLRIMLDKPDEPFPEPSESWFIDPATGRPDPAEKARYEQGRSHFRALQARTDVGGIAPVLAFLWYETGYRTALLYDQEARPNLEHFEYLYTLALNADRRQLSMGAFLDELAPLMGSAEKVETGDIAEQRNVVSFMTIHKSKGLEFPVVILANAGSYDRGGRNGKPYYRDPQFGPVVSLKSEYDKRKQRGLNYFYERGKELTRRQTGAELKRLFYVAATRAMKRLFIFGSVKVPQGDPEDPQGGGDPLDQFIQSVSAGGGKQQSFLTLLGRGFAAAGDRISHYRLIPFSAPGIEEYQKRMAALREAAGGISAGAVRGSAVAPPPGEKPRRAVSAPEEAVSGTGGFRLFYERPGQAPAAARRFTTPSLIEAYAATLRPAAASGLSRPGPEAGALLLPPFNCDPWLTSDALKRIFGTLCHRAIEELLTGTAGGDARRALQEAGVSEKTRRLMEEEARELARRFLDSPPGREAAAAARLCPEFPFILPLEVPHNKPVLVRGSMDLIYEYGGRCIILDFKTDRQFAPESHGLQMACYRAAAGAFSNLPAETRLVYLRDMRTVAVEPDPEEAALAELALGAAGTGGEEEEDLWN